MKIDFQLGSRRFVGHCRRFSVIIRRRIRAFFLNDCYYSREVLQIFLIETTSISLYQSKPIHEKRKIAI